MTETIMDNKYSSSLNNNGKYLLMYIISRKTEHFNLLCRKMTRCFTGNVPVRELLPATCPFSLITILHNCIETTVNNLLALQNGF